MAALLLLIAHTVGDFYLQSFKAVAEKQRSFYILLRHCFLYTLVMALALLMAAGLQRFLMPLIVIAVSHFLIDWLRIRFDRKAGVRDQIISYFVDQALHILIIIAVVVSFRLGIFPGGILQSANPLPANLLTYLLIYLVMLQPAAVTVKKVLTYIQEPAKEEESGPSPYNAGYLIGILERIITATLILNNQFAAIGFVLAAKSIARFRRLDDEEFAEKYLVGTLTSIAAAMLVTLILKTVFLS